MPGNREGRVANSQTKTWRGIKQLYHIALQLSPLSFTGWMIQRKKYLHHISRLFFFLSFFFFFRNWVRRRGCGVVEVAASLKQQTPQQEASKRQCGECSVSVAPANNSPFYQIQHHIPQTCLYRPLMATCATPPPINPQPQHTSLIWRPCLILFQKIWIFFKYCLIWLPEWPRPMD